MYSAPSWTDSSSHGQVRTPSAGFPWHSMSTAIRLVGASVPCEKLGDPLESAPPKLEPRRPQSEMRFIMSEHDTRLVFKLLALSLLTIFLIRCGDEDPTQEPPDVTADSAAEVDQVDQVDDWVEIDIAPDEDQGLEQPARVEIDLFSFLEPLADTGDVVSVFVSTSEDDLVGGEAAQSRIGDYVLENGHSRYVVEQDERALGACPYGGNILDAGYRGASDAEMRGDVVGEACLLLNLAQTLKPDLYEIISDGSDGGAGVLAVTGHLELLDFINLNGLVGSYLYGLDFDIPLDMDTLLPVTITSYYVLRPGDVGARVVTAIRNDSDDTLHFTAGHLIDSGGNVEFFNPISNRGFGYTSLGVDNFGEPLPFLGFRGEKASYVFAPSPSENLEDDLPIAGGYVTISGVAVTLLGTTDLLGTILATERQRPSMSGFRHVEPGAVDVIEHWHLSGDEALATSLNWLYPERGVETGRVSGVVKDSTGEPVAGARVTAIDPDGRPMNQDVSDSNGEFEMVLQTGAYEIRARAPGSVAEAPRSVNLQADANEAVDLTLTQASELSVRVQTPGGDPTPARVSVLCEGPCEHVATRAELDISMESRPGWAADMRYVGVDGEAHFTLVPGAYRVMASRGVTWSVWPPDALETRGVLIELGPGESESLVAEIAEVVDTTGVLSGDFHVHTINSPDSPVPLEDRVLNFMGEGVDVLVVTDHDYVSDVSDVIDTLGAEEEVVGVVGVELTTFDYGHYNAFPLVRDELSRNGGAFDWAGGPGPGKTPAEIFAALHDYPGEQVVQVNHADSGMIRLLQGSPLKGTTGVDPSLLRLPLQPGARDNDTGLWSDDFTTIELMNGQSLGRFWTIERWWLTMISRGFTPTGTAVSDTHRLFGSLGGSPRSYVFVDPSHDTPATVDMEQFVEAVNGNRLIGSNGPLFRVQATNGDAETAGLGEVIATLGEPVVFEVSIDIPDWMEVDRLDLFSNLDFSEIGASLADSSPLEPTATFPISFSEEDRAVVATGLEEHAHQTTTLDINFETEVDAYVVFVLSGVGEEIPSMFPVLGSSGVRPFAFSNPVYVDADGGGYDNPPFAHLVSEGDDEKSLSIPVRHREATTLDRETLIQVIEAIVTQHGR